jgi:hypothetical protein
LPEERLALPFTKVQEETSKEDKKEKAAKWPAASRYGLEMWTYLFNIWLTFLSNKIKNHVSSGFQFLYCQAQLQLASSELS